MKNFNVAIKFEDKNQSLSEKAYDLLVRKITRLELKPGTALAEKALVENLNIGRTPIREALHRLSAEGLVVYQTNRGMFVSNVDLENARHIYEFRALIDGYVARLAALRASAEDINALLMLQKQLSESIDSNDIDRFVDCDREFYLVLARAAQNIYLSEVIPRIFNLHLRLWFLISERLGEWNAIAQAHAEMAAGIVSAIERRDPDEAELAVKFYIFGRHKEIRLLL